MKKRKSDVRVLLIVLSPTDTWETATLTSTSPPEVSISSSTIGKSQMAQFSRLYPWLYEWVVAHGGSISAEHGIGQLKLPYSHLGKSKEEQAATAALKSVFDPHRILNPYKTLCL